MTMSKEEFVACIQQMARREREQRDFAEKEQKRREAFMLTDYCCHRWRVVKWGREYRKRRSN